MWHIKLYTCPWPVCAFIHNYIDVHSSLLLGSQGWAQGSLFTSMSSVAQCVALANWEVMFV